MFVLRQSLGMYDDIARHLAECDTKLQAELKNLGEKKIDLGKPPRFGSKQRKDYDTRQLLANWAASGYHPHQRTGRNGGDEKVLSAFRKALSRCYTGILCPGGEIGRRTSFRCWRFHDRGSSSLLLGTMK